MAQKVLVNLDLALNQLLNAVIQQLASAPSTTATGLMYYDTTLKQLGIYNGTSWDYYDTPASSTTFSNKSINASNNTISNLTLAMFAANVIDTDNTLSANSDLRVATQKAVKAYIAAQLANGVIYQSAIDCSANPNYPSATKGYMYRVSVAGKIGGASGWAVKAGDIIICNTTNGGGTQASVGVNFDVYPNETDLATTTTAGLVQLAQASDAQAKSSTSLAVTPAALANFPQKVTATIGDGSSTSIAVTHNLGNQDVVAQVRDASTNAIVLCDIVNTSSNVTTFTFAVAPASNAYKVTILG